MGVVLSENGSLSGRLEVGWRSAGGLLLAWLHGGAAVLRRPSVAIYLQNVA